jgi:hypothetical protein
MIKKVLGVFAVIIIALVMFISTRPDTYAVERSLAMKAPPATAYEYVANFKHFESWSPWSHLDPAMKKEFKGEGVGASYYWSGNDEVGEGRLTITNADVPNSVDMDLEFIRPFEDKAKTGFKIASEGEGSKVTWWMKGQNNFISKAMGVFMNMEEMIGNDYDKGLASLKPIVEKKAQEEAKLAEEAKAAAMAQPEVDPAAGADGSEVGTP